jgi:hypothetical protein
VSSLKHLAGWLPFIEPDEGGSPSLVVADEFFVKVRASDHLDPRMQKLRPGFRRVRQLARLSLRQLLPRQDQQPLNDAFPFLAPAMCHAKRVLRIVLAGLRFERLNPIHMGTPVKDGLVTGAVEVREHDMDRGHLQSPLA